MHQPASHRAPDGAGIFETDGAAALRAWLISTGTARSQLAQRLRVECEVDVLPARVSMWCVGDLRPSHTELDALEQLTGIAPIAWLFDHERARLIRWVTPLFSRSESRAA